MSKRILVVEELCHCTAAEWPLGWLLESSQRNKTRHHLYLREIKRDISYFSRSFRRAHISVDITGCGPDEASRKLREALTPAWQFQLRSDPIGR
jgi:hypothetical protein